MTYLTRGILPALLLAAPMLLSAQEVPGALDVCPLGTRLSSARPERACVESRERSAAPGRASVDPSAGLRLLPLRQVASYRTAYPMDRFNGLTWAGRGFSAGLSGGLVYRWRWLTAAVEPELAFAQNRAFVLPDTVPPGLSRMAYPWGYGRLDLYLRSGGRSHLEIGPGQSFVQADLGPARLGVSTEALRWGPARRYPLLFGGTAAGFPHVYAETGPPLSLPGDGRLSARLLWGQVRESDWFDANPLNDRSLLGALQLAWAPGFVPALELAYSLARHEPLPEGGLGLDRLSQLFTGDPDGEDVAERGVPMGTFAFRLHFPEDGVEAYGELGRGEGFLNPEPGVSEIGFNRIYLVGFTGTTELDSGVRWRVTGELMKQALARPQPRAGEDTSVVARRGWQGHTHLGQPLGAWVGPGSNAQFLAIDRLDRARRIGFYLERVRRDDDAYLREYYFDYGFRGYDLEWTVGLRVGGWLRPAWLERTLGPLEVSADLGISRRKNRWFIGLNDLEDRTFLREWNGTVDLYLTWDPALR